MLNCTYSTRNNLLKAFPQAPPSPHKIPLPLHKTKNSPGNSLPVCNKNERQWHCSGGDLRVCLRCAAGFIPNGHLKNFVSNSQTTVITKQAFLWWLFTCGRTYHTSRLVCQPNIWQLPCIKHWLRTGIHHSKYPKTHTIFLQGIIFIYVHMYVPAHLCAHHMCAVSTEVRTGCWIPGTGATRGY